MGDVVLRIHTEQDFRDANVQDQLVRVVRPDEVVRCILPLAQQFVSRLMPLGTPIGEERRPAFSDVFGASDKCLVPLVGHSVCIEL